MPTVKVPNLVAPKAYDHFASLCANGSIQMVMEPEDAGGITSQDVFGVVTGVREMGGAYLKIDFDLHEPHRFIERSRYEIRSFDNKAFIVQMEIVDTYEPGMVNDKPEDEEEIAG